MKQTKYTSPNNYETIVGERINEWIDTLTIENGCKRLPDEDDLAAFDCEIEWVTTQRGQRLIKSYISKANRLGMLIFDEEVDVEPYVNLIYA